MGFSISIPWFNRKKNQENFDKNNSLEKQLIFEEKRRKNLPILADHPTREMSIKGEVVEIDVDMMPVVEWLNNLENTFTKFCCQGGVFNPEKNPAHDQPYVCWHCSNQATISQIIKIFDDFKNKTDSCYHYIETEISWDQDLQELRYITRWFDNLALHDFIEWAGTNGQLTSHFKQTYSHLMKTWHSYDRI